MSNHQYNPRPSALTGSSRGCSAPGGPVSQPAPRRVVFHKQSAGTRPGLLSSWPLSGDTAGRLHHPRVGDHLATVRIILCPAADAGL